MKIAGGSIRKRIPCMRMWPAGASHTIEVKPEVLKTNLIHCSQCHTSFTVVKYLASLFVSRAMALPRQTKCKLHSIANATPHTNANK